MQNITINGISIYNRNTKETKEIYKSIFVRKDYNLNIKNNKPIIIDCGTHVGLATIYFKKKYPTAQITAIEANPDTVSCLRKNIRVNKLSDVKVIWGALCNKKVPQLLYVDDNKDNPWSWDDSIIKDIWSDRPSRKLKKSVKVPGILLSEIINSKVDLIKMDIEGAEYSVIKEVENKLDLVDRIIIEVHTTKKTPHENLKKIKSILKKHNFSIREYPIDWVVFIKAMRK